MSANSQNNTNTENNKNISNQPTMLTLHSNQGMETIENTENSNRLSIKYTNEQLYLEISKDKINFALQPVKAKNTDDWLAYKNKQNNNTSIKIADKHTLSVLSRIKLAESLPEQKSSYQIAKSFWQKQEQSQKKENFNSLVNHWEGKCTSAEAKGIPKNNRITEILNQFNIQTTKPAKKWEVQTITNLPPIPVNTVPKTATTFEEIFRSKNKIPKPNPCPEITRNIASQIVLFESKCAKNGQLSNFTYDNIVSIKEKNSKYGQNDNIDENSTDSYQDCKSESENYHYDSSESSTGNNIAMSTERNCKKTKYYNENNTNTPICINEISRQYDNFDFPAIFHRIKNILIRCMYKRKAKQCDKLECIFKAAYNELTLKFGKLDRHKINIILNSMARSTLYEQNPIQFLMYDYN
ncbi:hypothetical protein EDEG_00643 [Edhazardia aedis USNM 41457]|uniref:Uncharacterized protein n=1 Tax=Edhazardia aedis (strain USNM 41457) TaxID=1003232 RepID=J9DVJ1_EDHAE|nr:hypothetical protein EDEG_00643 [Edhazardia aedis USNM 41457]|eukprot:EJW05307.1 hypothetical protein EDEG_00643 [Edhazardia aedis USNM 41457]